jgi:hypothetical protein
MSRRPRRGRAASAYGHTANYTAVMQWHGRVWSKSRDPGPSAKIRRLPSVLASVGTEVQAMPVIALKGIGAKMSPSITGVARPRAFRRTHHHGLWLQAACGQLGYGAVV